MSNEYIVFQQLGFNIYITCGLNTKIPVPVLVLVPGILSKLDIRENLSIIADFWVKAIFHI